MRHAAAIALATLIGPTAVAADPAPPRAVQYGELTRLVREQQGKVVVVSFWHYN